MEHKILSISFALSAVAILFLSLLNPFTAFGAEYYSSETNTKSLLIDKKVRSIDDNQYYDNIEASKKIFYDKDVVEFQIKVENTGKETLKNVYVRDTLPKYFGLIFNPGNFNASQNTVEWTIDSLAPNETKTYLIRGKIKDADKLTVLTKQTNKAETNVDGIGDVDTASYFIGKVTVPDTGASDIVIKTVLVGLVAGSGLCLRKKVRGY